MESTRIDAAIRRSGMTNREVAKAAGLSDATVSSLRLGHRRTTERSRRKLARVLGYEVFHGEP